MGRKIYTMEVWNEGLNKHRIIRGSDKKIVMKKAELQLKAWDEMHEKKIIALEARINATKAKLAKINKKSRTY